MEGGRRRKGERETNYGGLLMIENKLRGERGGWRDGLDR